MRRLHAVTADWLIRLGQSRDAADKAAWAVVEHAADAQALRKAPWALIRPDSPDAPVFVAGMNSNRLRHDAGVTIVLDIVALTRVDDSSVDNDAGSSVIPA